MKLQFLTDCKFYKNILEFMWKMWNPERVTDIDNITSDWEIETLDYLLQIIKTAWQVWWFNTEQPVKDLALRLHEDPESWLNTHIVKRYQWNTNDFIPYLYSMIYWSTISTNKEKIIWIQMLRLAFEKAEDADSLLIIDIYSLFLSLKNWIWKWWSLKQKWNIEWLYEKYLLLSPNLTKENNTKILNVFALMFYWFWDKDRWDKLIADVIALDWANENGNKIYKINKFLYKIIFHHSQLLMDMLDISFSKQFKNRDINSQWSKRTINNIELSFNNFIKTAFSELFSMNVICIEKLLWEKQWLLQWSLTSLKAALESNSDFEESLKKIFEFILTLISIYKKEKFSSTDKLNKSRIFNKIETTILLNLQVVYLIRTYIQTLSEFRPQNLDQSILTSFSAFSQRLLALDFSVLDWDTSKNTIKSDESNYIWFIYDVFLWKSKNLNTDLLESYLSSEPTKLVETMNNSVKKILSIIPWNLRYYIWYMILEKYWDHIDVSIKIKLIENTLIMVDNFYSPWHNNKVWSISWKAFEIVLSNMESFPRNIQSQLAKIITLVSKHKVVLNGLFERVFTDKEYDRTKSDSIYYLIITLIRLIWKLHDIWKISTPLQILMKTWRLSNIEHDEMKSHPVNWIKIIEMLLKELPEDIRKLFWQWADHHERTNWSWYPNGISWEQIPLISQIVAFADIVDAICWWRVYDKNRRSIDEAIVEIDRSISVWLLDWEVIWVILPLISDYLKNELYISQKKE